MMDTSQDRHVMLSVQNLKKYFPVTKGFLDKKVSELRAVDGISFDIKKGETFGLVGESGCGKTTAGKCILGINKPTDGHIFYDGIELTALNRHKAKAYRRELQLIFQDPYSSLDPRQSVFSILAEAVLADGKVYKSDELQDRVDELLSLVELDLSMGYRYPHELSGGQRQRLGIARALACTPKLIVCDEPVSALDVSIQAQIINLFKSIQRNLDITYLFIAHDLAVVRHISDTIGVMYLGRFAEITNAKDLYINPLHPYTKALLSAVPVIDYHEEQNRNRIMLQGEVPSPMNVPAGCAFHPRCIYATEKCRSVIPELRVVGPNHKVACHNV